MTLDALKNFLADRPEYAFLAFALLAVGILWRAYRKAEAEKLEIALRVIPLADKLQTMLQKAAERRARSAPSTGGAP
jgi:cbb3-type cytochrome oxidase subunit 3